MRTPIQVFWGTEWVPGEFKIVSLKTSTIKRPNKGKGTWWQQILPCSLLIRISYKPWLGGNLSNVQAPSVAEALESLMTIIAGLPRFY